MEFSSQELWSGLPFASPGDLPDPGIKPESPVSPALTSRFFATEPSGKPNNTGVGSLSFLQQIFLTQELNWVKSLTLQVNSLLAEVPEKPLSKLKQIKKNLRK